MKRQCVFLDRDGVINVKPPAGKYVGSWQEFEFISGIINWIRIFNALDLLVVVVTNQRGIARGIISFEDLDDIHRRMRDQLAQAGARIDDIFICPHEQDNCDCRKPDTAMVLMAERKWNIDLSRSIMIGDSECDRQLAARCGMRFVHVRDGKVEEVVGVDEARVGGVALPLPATLFMK